MSPLPLEDIDSIIKALDGVWETFREKRIFITGGTGFFGRWLIESLLAANTRLNLGLSLAVLSRDPEKFLSGSPFLRMRHDLFFLRGDITDLSPAWVSAIRPESSKYDMIIHLVTEGNMGATSANPAAAAELIIGGTQRALHFGVGVGAQRFLFTSSGAVYGKQPQEIECMPEDFIGTPNLDGVPSAYAIGGEAKRQAELLCGTYTREGQIEAVIARGFAFVGPHLPLNGKFAVGNFLADAMEGRDLLVRGDGTPVRSYLYGSDLAIWLLKILAQGRPGRAYNVGSRRAVTIEQLARLLVDVSTKPLRVKILGNNDGSAQLDRYVPDVSRARNELGLREIVGLESALERTLSWLTSSPR